MNFTMWLVVFFFIFSFSVTAINETRICEGLGYNLSVTGDYTECQGFLELLRNRTTVLTQNVTQVTNYSVFPTTVNNYTMNMDQFYSLADNRYLRSEDYPALETQYTEFQKLLEDKITFYEDQLYLQQKSSDEMKFNQSMELMKFQLELEKSKLTEALNITATPGLTQDEVIDIVMRLTAEKDTAKDDKTVPVVPEKEPWIQKNWYLLVVFGIAYMIFKNQIDGVLNRNKVPAMNGTLPPPGMAIPMPPGYYPQNPTHPDIDEIVELKLQQKKIIDNQEKIRAAMDKVSSNGPQP